MSNQDPELWFEAVADDQRPILYELRKLIVSCMPDAIEEIRWNRPCYSTPTGMFSYLHSTKHHATIGFYKGASLKDPKNLLEGTGKDMRHVKVKSINTIDRTALSELIKQAVRLTGA